MTTTHIDRFFLAIDREDLITDERFDSDAGRLRNGELLREEIVKWTSERTKREVMERLGGAGVPCSATFDTRDLFEDPHLQERGFIHSVQHPTAGEVRMLGFAPRMSQSEVAFEPPPELGEHTDSVLREELGLEPDRLQALREAGAIG